MKSLIFRKIAAFAGLFAISLNALADTTFQLTWTGVSNSASATGYVTFADTTMLTTPATSNTHNISNITAFSMTIIGASAGNGTFGLSDITSAPIWTRFGLDLTRNLVGQTNGTYTFTSMTLGGSGDFNIFTALGSCGSSTAPYGYAPFEVKANCSSSGDLLRLTSILLGSASSVVDLRPNADALRGAYSLQSAIINTGLTYDCTTFDKNGICLSAGGRVTDTVNPSTNSQGALLIASYRANDNWRIGGYLDQNLSTNDARGVNLDNSNPMGGVFAVWNQNTDGTGYQVRVAAGYSDKDVTITRNSGLNTEAGTGESSLRSQAYSAIISRGFQINDTRWIASPYLGVRYTKIKRAGYTEDSTTDVTAPLTYSALSQETTTALAGVRFNGQFGDKVNVMASAGVESDIAHNTGDYAATGVSGLTPIAFNENIRHVRPVAQAGVRYAIDKRQTIGANLNYRQEVFNSTHSVTGMVNYELGF